jgi:predicted DNA-binding protein
MKVMQNDKPVSIRIDAALDRRIKAAADAAGIPKTDIMRIAIGLGIKDLESISFDIDGAIYDRVSKVKSELRALPNQENGHAQKQG